MEKDHKKILSWIKEILVEEDIWESPEIPNSFRLEGLASIANASKGSYRDALQYLERCLSGGFYTPESIRDNLGIVDENSILKIIFALLEKDESVWIDINRLDPSDVFNLILTLVTDAYVYTVSGMVANEIYEDQTKQLAKHPNFGFLYEAISSLRESSKTYLRKSDLKNALASYWYNSKKNILADTFIPVEKKSIPIRKRRVK